MRIWKIIMITSLLCAVSISSFGCASESDSVAVTEGQVVTVQRGDLVIDITAVGNLVFSHKEELAFEVSGTIGEVLVEADDSVEEGQVLAQLDTTPLERAVKTGEQAVKTKKLAVEIANIELEDTPSIAIRVLKAQLARDKAKNDLDQAQYELDKAKDELDKAVIVAPFSGIVTGVSITTGEEVKKGAAAISLTDPAKFEAEIMVSEMDIFQVKLGGEASVQVDAMSMIVLPAKVSYISPTATIQSGVVNYKVKVEIQSLEAVMQERQEAMQKAMPAMIPEDFQLREGLTVTVSILIEEKHDVLLVPNAAITSQGGQTYVQIVSPDGTTEERTIKTGISNWQYTEVTDGLSEGEKVVITQATTTPTTPQKGPMFIPGTGVHTEENGAR